MGWYNKVAVKRNTTVWEFTLTPLSVRCVGGNIIRSVRGNCVVSRCESEHYSDVVDARGDTIYILYKRMVLLTKVGLVAISTVVVRLYSNRPSRLSRTLQVFYIQYRRSSRTLQIFYIQYNGLSRTLHVFYIQ